MKNLKYGLLVSSFLMIGVSILLIYDAYRPRVGPIGNGPNETALWTNFIFFILFGIALFASSIYLFLTDDKRSSTNDRNKQDPRYLVIISIFFIFMVVRNSITIIQSSDSFMRMISVITIIPLSMVIGAFLREIFILRAERL
ncbi:hypothetical protein BEP19_03000 [Ammoniphilus oxalaticus]|uniref:Uncharacterized protein n=1 Tax=Ammoniphilus oxalaticus TaxID=66863 RepID=A0A419SNU0_9BACL|nr:hypothetical protein [Ammoniphilus oxalaticus]RKD25912.1 hypothetical protein BEP19_03000 [Ammoniphilus oxalaticus]